jgi:hypothetical protein
MGAHVIFGNHPVARKIVAGGGAFVLADLIIGMAAFSTIVLAALWYFSLGWLQLTAEFQARGMTFGSAWQLDLAWVELMVGLPLIVLTVILGVRAFSLPRSVYRAGKAPH